MTRVRGGEMTEWNAAEYATVSELQRAMAAEALSLLNLKGTERVLDLGSVTAKLRQKSPLAFLKGLSWASTHLRI